MFFLVGFGFLEFVFLFYFHFASFLISISMDSGMRL